MASVQDQERRPRSKRTVGNASHDAQQGVDKRVMEIMACRNAAEGLEPPRKKAFAGAGVPARGRTPGRFVKWPSGTHAR
jgi:hypothetical protein